MSYSSLSDDDEIFSDSEMFDNMNITVLRKPRTLKTHPDHFDLFGDREFYQRYRLTKSSAYSVLELVGPHIANSTNWNKALTAEQMFLMTLRVYATGGMLRTVGDLFAVSKSTVSIVVDKVTHCIAKLANNFIKFPSTPEELCETMEQFYDITKFPKVIGALDCTHIRIISPGGKNAELFRNRKGFFSVNVQTICDAKLKIRNIVARWHGSAHDSNILRNSRIYSRLESGEFGDGIILADGGYPNKSFLITPLLNPQRREERLYNEAQIRTRCCGERSYGVWKRRFPILSLGIRLNFRKAEGIIVATAVLYNICCMNNEVEPPMLPENIANAVESVSSVPNNRNVYGSNISISRQILINEYFGTL